MLQKKKHSKIHLSTKQTIFIDFNIHFCFQNTMLTTGTEQKSLGSDLHNFKELLNKVKEIMDGKTKLWTNHISSNIFNWINFNYSISTDSFSDNVELSTAANQLEHVLDDIIDKEEKKHVQTYF